VTDSSKPENEASPPQEHDSQQEERSETSSPGGRSGPTFNDAPDPLSGISKWASDTWQSTEGRTVSMRVYIGTIIGVVVLMMLARCGG